MNRQLESLKNAKVAEIGAFNEQTLKIHYKLLVAEYSVH